MAGKRTIGIFLVAVFYMLAALGNFANIAISLLLYSRGRISGIPYINISISFIFLCASIVTVVGVLILKEWGRVLAIIMSAINVLLTIAVIALTAAKGGNLSSSALPIILSIAIISYLTRPRVKEIFGGHKL